MSGTLYGSALVKRKLRLPSILFEHSDAAQSVGKLNHHGVVVRCIERQTMNRSVISRTDDVQPELFDFA